jgi:hypothetical protein
VRLSILSSLLLVAMTTAHAQDPTPAELCIKNYFASFKKTGRSLGISVSEADDLVHKVAKSIGMSEQITVVPCSYASKAGAWSINSDPEVTSGEYIIYNPVWIREVIGNDQFQAIVVFGHELGHFVNRHFDARAGLPSVQKEAEADRFAGCAVARMRGQFSSLRELLSRLRSEEKTSNYPDRFASIESARSGFVDCGGNTIPQPKEVLSDECEIFDCSKR